MLAAVRQFNPTIWLVILATFAGRFALFMIWPFLAVLLHRQFGLNAFEVGLFLTSATGAGVLFGFYAGYLADKVGRRRIILFGLGLSVVGLLILGFADSLGLIFVGTLVQACARPMIEDPGRALMTDTVEDREVKDMALHLRYFAINVGAATGPLLGAMAGLTGAQGTFFLVAAVYGAYLLATILVFRTDAPARRSAAPTDFTVRDVLGVLARDRAFLLFVLAGFLSSLAYGQTETGLVQYLELAAVPDIATLYALLIATNAITIVVFQFPLLKLTARLTPFRRAMTGVALFAVGFLGFAVSPIEPPFALMGAMFVLSIGEAILFPTLSLIIDRIAVPRMKSSYFGAYSLNVFGFALAPFAGGWLLHVAGGMALWLAMSALALVVAGLFALANRISPRMT